VQMMADLFELNCVRPSPHDSPLTGAELGAYLAQAPQWKLIEEAGEQRIQRVFGFKNFSQALAFTNQVGAIAEQQDHHPAVLTEWGRVTVTWWTHAIKGLHRNDFIMAAKTDREFSLAL
jgi:4a-hydroxytetrahydrobiopterin dehydratase